MRLSLTILFAAAAAVVAQDTVSVTSGSDCEPHGDHWHCPAGVPEPTTPPTPEQLASHSVDEAAEESTPTSNAVSTTVNVISSGSILVTPSASSHSHDGDDDDDDDDHAATASTCEPHGDHWHCPFGVSEPTTPPAQTVSSTVSRTAATSASGSQAPQQTGNAAAQVGAGQMAVLFGAAAYFL